MTQLIQLLILMCADNNRPTYLIPDTTSTRASRNIKQTKTQKSKRRDYQLWFSQPFIDHDHDVPKTNPKLRQFRWIIVVVSHRCWCLSFFCIWSRWGGNKEELCCLYDCGCCYLFSSRHHASQWSIKEAAATTTMYLMIILCWTKT